MTHSFKRLQTHGWHGYLMERMYRDTVTHHRRTHRPKDVTSQGYTELFNFEAHPHIYRRAVDIALLRRRWRLTVSSSIADDHTEDVFGSDRKMSRFGMLLSTCQPAGVVLHDTMPWITCGKYMVCPFCRYRKALEVLIWLEPYRQSAGKIAYVSYLHEYTANCLPVWDLIRSRLRKRRGTWICDYVLHAPAYDAGDRAWYIRTTLIVLWDGDAPLFDPQVLVPANDPRAQGLNSNGTWTVSRPTKRGLVDAVCAGLHYAPETLDFGQSFPGRLFINLARLTAVCRCGGTPGHTKTLALNIQPQKQEHCEQR